MPPGGRAGGDALPNSLVMGPFQVLRRSLCGEGGQRKGGHLNGRFATHFSEKNSKSVSTDFASSLDPLGR